MRSENSPKTNANLLDEIQNNSFSDQYDLIKKYCENFHYDFRVNEKIKKNTEEYISYVKQDKKFRVEQFLQKYSLSSEEGIAVMCLAEALVRIPDAKTCQELILDKLSKKDWRKYISIAKSHLLSLSSVGLYVAGKTVDLKFYDNFFAKLTSNFIDPILLNSIKAAIKFLSKEFIIGFDIDSGLKQAKKNSKFLYSFDLLGESARNQMQANFYFEQYNDALDKINLYFPAVEETLYNRPNFSVKLSALHPRIENTKWETLKLELMPKLIELVKKARDKKIAITFDAEEAKRQEIYLKILTNLISDPEFNEYNGIGFVVQAYSKRALYIIKYLKNLAEKYKKIIPVRLVKGAYWDNEIKYAQENGFTDYPVFTSKILTDANYLICAKELLTYQEFFYPQFATHNAQTTATIEHLAEGKRYEMQKLFGMGSALYEKITDKVKIREYAPIGGISELLAYLMRRLLENGANTSFVNKVNDEKITSEELTKSVYDEYKTLLANKEKFNLPSQIYPNRINSKGIDLGYNMNLEQLKEKISVFNNKIYEVGSIVDGTELFLKKHSKEIFRPGKNSEKIGEYSKVAISELKNSLESSKKSYLSWSKISVQERANILRKLSDLLEENQYEIYSILIREAGKSITDAVNELREAIDFCRYYALKAEDIIKDIHLPGPTGEKNILTWNARGVFLCISPWNFPLAIFLGQIVAALVSGNSVIAKPAEQTPIIANFVSKLILQAGVPKDVFHLVIASGATIDEYLVRNDHVSGVAFTGSTETAKIINLSIASRSGALIPFVAETGGQNAMIVDSSALLEQVSDDVINSSFYSAGQRCSALRILYIQEEIYDNLLEMIKGAADQLKIGDTIDFENDIGPVIDQKSKENLQNHINDMSDKGYNISMHKSVSDDIELGNFFYPHIIEISSINDVDSEKFGPILHVIKYKSKDLDKIIDEINDYGYGLTFGIHSRINEKIEYIRSKIHVGNIYANRTMTGAQVESQPFGGENKSGTGFKAGGPHYLLRFMTERAISNNLTAIGGNIELLSSK